MPARIDKSQQKTHNLRQIRMAVGRNSERIILLCPECLKEQRSIQKDSRVWRDFRVSDNVVNNGEHCELCMIQQEIIHVFTGL